MSIVNGTLVELKDLVKASMHNGRKGGIIGFNEDTGRYDVVLVDDEHNNANTSDRGTVLKILPANIQVHEGASPENFPFKKGYSVEIVGLIAKPEFNGKLGEIVQDPEQDSERFSVKMVTTGNVVLLKPKNMIFKGYVLPSSSVAAAATASSASNNDSFVENQLRQLNSMTPQQMKEQASRIKNMSSAELQTLRATNPHMRNMTDAQLKANAAQMELMADNPAMLEMAKNQMQNNPELIKSALRNGGQVKPEDVPQDQMKNQAEMILKMSDSELDAMRKLNPQVAGLTNEQIRMNARSALSYTATTTTTPSSTNSTTPSNSSSDGDVSAQIKMAQQQLKTMSPEMMKQQASMLRQMARDPASFESLKQMNPQFANMSPEQIEAQCAMMETMADNPAMMKTMVEQAEKNPEMMEKAMRSMQGGGGIQTDSHHDDDDEITTPGAKGVSSSSQMPPQQMMNMMSSDMLNNLTTEQMKAMLQTARAMAKSDPEGFRKMTGFDPKQLEAMDQMDEAQLDKALNGMKSAVKYMKPFIVFYQKLNVMTNGKGAQIIALFFVLLIVMLIRYFFFSSSSTEQVPISTTTTTMKELKVNGDSSSFAEVFEDEL